MTRKIAIDDSPHSFSTRMICLAPHVVGSTEGKEGAMASAVALITDTDDSSGSFMRGLPRLDECPASKVGQRDAFIAPCATLSFTNYRILPTPMGRKLICWTGLIPLLLHFSDAVAPANGYRCADGLLRGCLHTAQGVSKLPEMKNALCPHDPPPHQSPSAGS